MQKMSLRCFFAWLLYVIMQAAMGIGAAIVIIGYMNAVVHVHDVKVSYFFRVLGIILIVIGTTVFVLALIGLLGSCLKNRCLLNTFTILLMTLLVGQLIAVITVYSFYNEETLANELKSSMQYYNKDKDIRTFWDLINNKLECCGVDSVADWHDNIPNSCCKDLNINDVCHKELANEKPCLNQIVRILEQELPVGLVYIGMIQVFCLAASCSIYPLRHENV